MTRDELELRLWHHMPRAHSSVIISILADVDAYMVAEVARAARRRRILAGELDAMPDEIPVRLRRAHAMAKRCRLTGLEIPDSVARLQREYWRLKKRQQRERAA